MMDSVQKRDRLRLKLNLLTQPHILLNPLVKEESGHATLILKLISEKSVKSLNEIDFIWA